MPALTSLDTLPAHEAGNDVWQEWINLHPLYRSTGLSCTSMTVDEAEFGLGDSDLPLNPNGAVNGGVIALAVDLVLGAVGMRRVATGQLPMTTTLNVVYHAPALPPLVLHGSVLRSGRAVLSIQVDVVGSDDRSCCIGIGTMSVGDLGRRSGPP